MLWLHLCNPACETWDLGVIGNTTSLLFWSSCLCLAVLGCFKHYHYFLVEPDTWLYHCWDFTIQTPTIPWWCSFRLASNFTGLSINILPFTREHYFVLGSWKGCSIVKISKLHGIFSGTKLDINQIKTWPSHHPMLNILRPLVSSWYRLEWGGPTPPSISPESDVFQEMVGTNPLHTPHSCFPCYISHWFSITSVVWKYGPWIRASTSFVTQPVIQILRPHPDPLHHKLWEWVLAICVVTSPPPCFSCILKLGMTSLEHHSHILHISLFTLPSLLSNVPCGVAAPWSVKSPSPSTSSRSVLHTFLHYLKPVLF